VHPKKQFSEAFLTVISAFMAEEDIEMPCTLGTYTIRSPDQGSLPIDFQATVTCMVDESGDDNDPVWHFELSNCS